MLPCDSGADESNSCNSSANFPPLQIMQLCLTLMGAFFFDGWPGPARGRYRDVIDGPGPTGQFRSAIAKVQGGLDWIQTITASNYN